MRSLTLKTSPGWVTTPAAVALLPCWRLRRKFCTNVTTNMRIAIATPIIMMVKTLPTITGDSVSVTSSSVIRCYRYGYCYCCHRIYFVIIAGLTIERHKSWRECASTDIHHNPHPYRVPSSGWGSQGWRQGWLLMDSFIFRHNDMKMRREEERRRQFAYWNRWADSQWIKYNKNFIREIINSSLKIELQIANSSTVTNHCGWQLVLLHSCHVCHVKI